jgi:ppGpp synthetase/RelA/SpoT-type nucleotidyltranferase
MHDIAGVHTILRTIEKIDLVRDGITKSRTHQKPLHARYENEYILKLKTTGYRELHQGREKLVKQGTHWMVWNSKFSFALPFSTLG